MQRDLHCLQSLKSNQNENYGNQLLRFEVVNPKYLSVFPRLSHLPPPLLRSSSPSTVWARTSPLRRGWKAFLWTCRLTHTATTTAGTNPSTVPTARSKYSVTREQRGRSETRSGNSPVGKGRALSTTPTWLVSQASLHIMHKQWY